MQELLAELLKLQTYDLEARNWHEEMRPQHPLDNSDLEWYTGGEWVRMEDVLELVKKHLGAKNGQSNS